ncbi:hypothetical protein SSPO_005810 [Streptomyces antimycoticus]|uniref:Uncharacterized protein n=1 Tax=Streptomyces antimycoticus TaxID=68175 RepID=A0A499UAW0_9ACTN|nr:hypothetical protein SSPO_005810 [Streptomyces antimycoticus]
MDRPGLDWLTGPSVVIATHLRLRGEDAGHHADPHQRSGLPPREAVADRFTSARAENALYGLRCQRTSAVRRGRNPAKAVSIYQRIGAAEAPAAAEYLTHLEAEQA